VNTQINLSGPRRPDSLTRVAQKDATELKAYAKNAVLAKGYCERRRSNAYRRTWDAALFLVDRDISGINVLEMTLHRIFSQE
jgi:hypothetical protein